VRFIGEFRPFGASSAGLRTTCVPAHDAMPAAGTGDESIVHAPTHGKSPIRIAPVADGAHRAGAGDERGGDCERLRIAHKMQ
jgi:hypothetical protein